MIAAVVWVLTLWAVSAVVLYGCYALGHRAGARHGLALAEKAKQDFDLAMTHESDASRKLYEQLSFAERAVSVLDAKHAHCTQTIQMFSDQRDNWQKLYFQQSIAHGNAQTLMMETIDRLGKQLRDHGIEPKILPILRQVQQDFRQEHVAPALAGGYPEGTLSTDRPSTSQIEKLPPGGPINVPG